MTRTFSGPDRAASTLSRQANVTSSPRWTGMTTITGRSASSGFGWRGPVPAGRSECRFRDRVDRRPIRRWGRRNCRAIARAAAALSASPIGLSGLPKSGLPYGALTTTGPPKAAMSCAVTANWRGAANPRTGRPRWPAARPQRHAVQCVGHAGHDDLGIDITVAGKPAPSADAAVLSRTNPSMRDLLNFDRAADDGIAVGMTVRRDPARQASRMRNRWTRATLLRVRRCKRIAAPSIAMTMSLAANCRMAPPRVRQPVLSRSAPTGCATGVGDLPGKTTKCRAARWCRASERT